MGHQIADRRIPIQGILRLGPAVESALERGYHAVAMNETQRPKDYYRFCPGEEHVKLSDAICRGRRRSHFPKCRGCQFNDDSPASPPEGIEPISPPGSIESLFLADEICGLTPAPLSTDAAWRIGHATGQYLRGKLRGYERADHTARAIVVGRDTRPHSAAIQEALVGGIRGYGIDVIDIGVVDTAQLLFAIDHIGACGGIQTTAGHRPAEYNGFRLGAARGGIIGCDTGLASIRDIAARVPRHNTGANASLTEVDLAQPYGDYVRSFLVGAGKLPRPVKVVADAGNGVAGRWLPIVLEGIRNLTVVPLNFQHDGGFAHDPDPTAAKNTRELRRLVKQHRANFGVCFDSDCSRCTFVDEKGVSIPPDTMAALLAQKVLERQPRAGVVFDLRSSLALAEEIERGGGAVSRAKADRASLRKTMVEQNAAFGSDLFGGYYFRESSFCESALLAFNVVLSLMATAGRKLSELVRPIHRYRSSGEISVACARPEEVFQKLAAAHGEAQLDYLDGLTARYADWWFNLRQEGHEARLRLIVQARAKKLVDQKVADVESLLASVL